MLKDSLHPRDTKVVINHRVGNFILNSMLSYLSIKSLHKQVIQKLHVKLNLYACFVLSLTKKLPFGIRLDTKLKVYKAVVLSTHLYACETWTVYQRHAKKLNHFNLGCLRKILKIRWQDKIPDTEVLKKANMQSVHTLLKLAQLRWAGHVTRMPDERLPKKVLYGELQEGKRS